MMRWAGLGIFYLFGCFKFVCEIKINVHLFGEKAVNDDLCLFTTMISNGLTGVHLSGSVEEKTEAFRCQRRFTEAFFHLHVLT